MTTLMPETAMAPAELEADNSARLAIFDAMSDARDEGRLVVSADELFDRVIGRLRVLVPRELYNVGELEYLRQKIAVCIGSDMLVSAADGGVALSQDPEPWIRYPDESIRRYTRGLVAARERLDVVNANLRERRFDVTKHIPHHKPSSAEFRALVRSMEEHGFLKQFAIYRFSDGTYVDGFAREAAAIRAGVEPKWLELRQQDPETTRMRRRDTPLHRVLLAVDSNAVRLTDDQRSLVLEAAAAAVGRSWEEIAADLALTRDWRSATARSYTPTFEVTEIPFDGDSGRTIQVTSDHKIHVTSLLRASGLAKHKFDTELKDRVTSEKARVRGGGPAAIFARAADLVEGLEAMIAERREHGRKVSPEWDASLDWLHDYARRNRIDNNGS